MSKLVVVGSSREVYHTYVPIKFLEQLGGRNVYGYTGVECGSFYLSENNIILPYLAEEEDVVLMPVFAESKWPYRVGDIVVSNGYICEITRMYWDGERVRYDIASKHPCVVAMEDSSLSGREYVGRGLLVGELAKF